MKRYIISILIIFTSVIASAQENMSDLPVRTADFEMYKSRVSNLFSDRSLQIRPSCINKTLSVHIHLIGENSDDSYLNTDEIQESFDSLNLAFSPICVNFEICKTTYHNNSIYFEELVDTNYTKVYKLYADTGVINIFYIRNFINPARKGASLPYPSGFFALSTTSHKALIHEMGHFLGLMHTSAGDDELVDGSNCDTTGDLLCDTEADFGTYLSCQFNYTVTDANGDYYTPPVYNYMTHIGNICGEEFSPMQYMVMIDYILNVRTDLH